MPAAKAPASTAPKPFRLGGKWTAILFSLPLFLSAPLAVVIQVLRAPDHVAQPAPPLQQRPLMPLIATALSSPGASALELSLAEINGHLAQTLLPARSSAGSWTLQQVATRLEPGRCEIMTLQKWNGWDIHLNATYQVSIQSGKIRFQMLSGDLGRLHLSPFWMERFEKPLLHIVPFLRKERVLLDRLSDLKIDHEKVTLRVRVTGA